MRMATSSTRRADEDGDELHRADDDGNQLHPPH